MAQWLKHRLLPACPRQLTPSVTLVGSEALFRSLWTTGTHVLHRCACRQNTQTCKKKKSICVCGNAIETSRLKGSVTRPESREAAEDSRIYSQVWHVAEARRNKRSTHTLGESSAVQFREGKFLGKEVVMPLLGSVPDE